MNHGAKFLPRSSSRFCCCSGGTGEHRRTGVGAGMRRSREEGEGSWKGTSGGFSAWAARIPLSFQQASSSRSSLSSWERSCRGSSKAGRERVRTGWKGRGAPVKPQHQGEIKATADIQMKVGLRTKSAVLGLPRSSFASRDPFRASSSFLKLSEA